MLAKVFGSERCYFLLVLVFLSCCLSEVSSIECQYCKKDFKSLGRHVWRCKSKVVIDNAQITENQPSMNIPVEIEIPARSIANNERLIEHTNDPPDIREDNEKDVSEYVCYCGRVCKGLRGLQAHKRACKILDIPDIKALFENPTLHEVDEAENENDLDEEVIREYCERLNGIKLPSTSEEWNVANEHFKVVFNDDNISDLNDYVKNVQYSIYRYFHDKFGTVKGGSDNNFSHYNSMSNRQLKSTLRNLKHTNADDIEIKHVARLLRKRMCKDSMPDNDTEYHHAMQFKRDFWKYCKSTFEPKERVKPETTENDCFNYFCGKLRHKNKHKQFRIPAWMKTLANPSIVFDQSPPKYHEIASIIRKMRTSASPCPFDQISVIGLKKCPMLRTVVWRILKRSWEEKGIPLQWKSGLTVLAYKKGAVNNLENFRPITLEPVMLKVMTSWMRNRIYKFLAANNFIDGKLQKGFWSGVSGTIEHNETLSYIINQARMKQKSVCITLIDLRNAFGEVHHSLINEVMKFHHLPEVMCNFVADMYQDFTISVGTEDFITRPIEVHRGVLQGDSLSPLLFNMCFNTLMKTVDQNKIRCSGYVFGNTLSPRNWFQFADDTTIVTSLETDNQFLLNLFQKWCIWADFIIRLDKCHTFAIKKSHTESVQYLPYLTLGKERVPPVEMGERFTYLGKEFGYSMDNQHAKDEILEKMEEVIGKTDCLPLHPRHKIQILTVYMYSKLKWAFSCYQLDETWLKQSCDSLVLRYFRKWLNFHPGANTCHLSLPFKKLGLNLTLPTHVYQQCKVTVRRILRTSQDKNIRSLYVVTHNKNINTDQIVESADENNEVTREACKKLLKEKLQISSWEKFMKLKKQNIIAKFITENCQPLCVSSWNKVVNSLSRNLFCFMRKALILALPTNKNLKTWGLIEKEFCPLCQGDIHTQHHILNHCSAAANQQRYLWRHNSVLNLMVYQISPILSSSMKLFVDIPGHVTTDSLFTCAQRPDLVLVTALKMFIVELTVCFETNLTKSREFKTSRYKYLKDNVTDTSKDIELIFIEISSLGFYTKDIKNFKNFLKHLKLDSKRILEKLCETSIRCSYYIYNRRLKDWTSPELLLFT